MNAPARTYRYYDFVMAAFVTILLCSNVIGASKVCDFHGFAFSAAVLFFPVSYIFGDVLTEVYGYGRDRRVIWAGFAALVFASVMSLVILKMPPAPGWPNQAAFEAAFGNTWRIVAASLLAFWFGSFANSYVMAKMKIASQGRHLWMRTIGSTLIGEFVDSLFFYPLAFYGVWETSLVLKVLFTNYLVKVGCEVLMTPITYRVVAFLKRTEGEDFYDRGTNFNPFHVS